MTAKKNHASAHSAFRAPGFSPLCLLDDAPPRSPLSSQHWIQLTQEACRPRAAERTVAMPTKTVAVAVQKKKLFSSSPTLRQLMHEYNGAAPVRAFKKAAAPRPQAAATNAADFRWDRIDCLDIPCVPGKILRPKNR